ncbi:MAG: hypothetical protein AAGA10_29970, partial [Bacteroidota bacterium]
PHCPMRLVSLVSLEWETSLQLNEIKFRKGSGKYLISGGKGHESDTITVHYHLPEKFGTHSPVLLVIPGAGRNGDSYRDAWVEESETFGVLILSPTFPEEGYPFQDYHLGGTVELGNLRTALSYTPNSNQVVLTEEQLVVEPIPDSESWLFPELDRIFEGAMEVLGTGQTQYDAFGHSAGGQILHRLTLFYPQTKAQRILAANAGFYTLPDLQSEPPFGLKGSSLTPNSLQQSLEKQLIVLVGELDNANETGGTLLRSPSADKQGLHRLDRGKYFYQYGQQFASEEGIPMNWTLHIVPGVGHDHRKMGDAAAALLYER